MRNTILNKLSLYRYENGNIDFVNMNNIKNKTLKS